MSRCQGDFYEKKKKIIQINREMLHICLLFSFILVGSLIWLSGNLCIHLSNVMVESWRVLNLVGHRVFSPESCLVDLHVMLL